MLAFLFGFFLTITEPQTIQGYIRDQYGNPLAGVTIQMNRQKTTSDNLGHFTIHSVPENSKIGFTATGYTPSIQSVKARQNEWHVIMKEQSPEIRQQP